MSHLYLAEYQMRLLMCSPWRKKPLAANEGDSSAARLLWRCGCSAVQCADHKYQITACDDHFALLREVREDEERYYDAPAEPNLFAIPRSRFRGVRVV
jgi:hypothetical protein